MTTRRLETLLTPADFEAAGRKGLSGSVCVVFDILRATTTMMTALNVGAERIIPVAEIDEAVALRRKHPEYLLAGERDGVRILSHQSGGVDFDLGNSPREFTASRVRGKTIVMTTTNGTRALRACAGAGRVLIASLPNLPTLASWVSKETPASLVLVCAGTGEEAAYEDMLAAGALCDSIWPDYATGNISDTCEMARQIYRVMQRDLLSAMQYSKNGRRLLANPDLSEDVRLCVQRGTMGFLAHLDQDGSVRRIEGSGQ
jgi:2-phosphosulfolactate phosphatase